MFKLIKWFVFLAIIALGYVFYQGWQAKEKEDRRNIKSGLIELIDKGESKKLKEAVKENLALGKEKARRALKGAVEKYVD